MDKNKFNKQIRNPLQFYFAWLLNSHNSKIGYISIQTMQAQFDPNHTPYNSIITKNLKANHKLTIPIYGNSCFARYTNYLLKQKF